VISKVRSNNQKLVHIDIKIQSPSFQGNVITLLLLAFTFALVKQTVVAMETSNSDDRCRMDGMGLKNPLHQQPSDAAQELSHHSSIPESIRNLLREEAQYYVDDRSLEDQKRVSYLSWDDYFMAIAFLSARRSKDPLTPTGACLVDEENRVIGIGYNGFPWGCPDDLLPWQSARASSTSLFPAIAVDDTEEKEDSSATQLPYLHTSSPFECRAELNAILNKCSATVAGARLYVPNFPCT
jgi:deoxycytidylate deaminase